MCEQHGADGYFIRRGSAHVAHPNPQIVFGLLQWHSARGLQLALHFASRLGPRKFESESGAMKPLNAFVDGRLCEKPKQAAETERAKPFEPARSCLGWHRFAPAPLIVCAARRVASTRFVGKLRAATRPARRDRPRAPARWSQERRRQARRRSSRRPRHREKCANDANARFKRALTVQGIG